MSKYELLKDISSPIGSCKAGVIGKDDGYGRIWFEGQYWNKETCDAQTAWFKKINDRIEVKDFWFSEHKANGMTGYCFITSTAIPRDKHDLIKQAIERVLNDESDHKFSSHFEGDPEYVVYEGRTFILKRHSEKAMEQAFIAARHIPLKLGGIVSRFNEDIFSYPTFESYIKSLNK